MTVDSNVAPVIIKKKKVSGGDGHHGGAWKVAYADFVTAMMAFFMLMWLLNATTEKQRKGLADYFNPTVAISRVSGGGDGSLGGDSVFPENTLPRIGTGATNLRPTPDHAASGAVVQGPSEREEQGETEKLEKVEELLMGRGGESMVDDGLRRHIVTRVTDEGLVIELFETDDVPLFGEDGSPTAMLRALAGVIVRVSEMVTNPLAVEGHVSAYPIVLARNPAWEVSSDRADRFRRLLLGSGIDADRVSRVTAHADRELTETNPMDRRNNRLEIIFLREI